jgi:hypothetical protein
VTPRVNTWNTSFFVTNSPAFRIELVCHLNDSTSHLTLLRSYPRLQHAVHGILGFLPPMAGKHEIRHLEFLLSTPPLLMIYRSTTMNDIQNYRFCAICTCGGIRIRVGTE